MNKYKLTSILLILNFLIAGISTVSAQISSVANSVVSTDYSSGAQDNIHVFCTVKNTVIGSLTATCAQGETGNFEWQRYDAASKSFVFYSDDKSGNQTSTVSGLTDGAYRVKITSASGTKSYTAWVFNNFIEASAEIPESDCNSLLLNGIVHSPEFVYVDLPTGKQKTLDKKIEVVWKNGEITVGRFANFRIYDPPTKNTTFGFEVSDRFGCSASAEVQYESIVTKASFTYKLEGQDKKSDPRKIEVPLTVTFTNTSENGDKFEWHFFKDLQVIKNEIKANTFKDSIAEIIYDVNPVYTYENTGDYKVKLVSKKITGNNVCTSTFYMKDYIVADSSFIDAPNVFTPNGDGKNDNFAVKFFSMKTVKISIFNRWGKIVHTWESNNVQGFYNTATTVPQSVWDGKVGGQYATPGVYFWVAEGVGRDGEKRKGNGFFHLFRDK